MDSYEKLANAIILSAVKDYRTALRLYTLNPHNRQARSATREVERFFRSQWYRDLTNVDAELLIKDIKEEYT